MQISKSNKLANVCYDIRGPVLKHAKRLEDEGHRVLKLNIGNPAPFGFEAPEEILQDVIRNLPTAQGYSDSKGLFSARKAVMQYYQQKKVEGVGIEDIYLGNGVSELIVMVLQALLNNGDEVLNMREPEVLARKVAGTFELVSHVIEHGVATKVVEHEVGVRCAHCP